MPRGHNYLTVLVMPGNRTVEYDAVGWVVGGGTSSAVKAEANARAAATGLGLPYIPNPSLIGAPY